MKIYSFEKLEVWMLSKKFVLRIYKLTGGFPDCERYGLVNQLRRAAISISTNLAEGSGRNTTQYLNSYTPKLLNFYMGRRSLIVQRMFRGLVV